MFFGDAPAYYKSQSGALSFLFRGKKRGKYAGFEFFRDSRAVIRDRKINMISVMTASYFNSAVFRFILKRRAGVIEKIDQYLLNLLEVRKHRGGIFIKMGYDRDIIAFFKTVLQQIERCLNRRRQVHGLFFVPRF